MKLAHFLSSAVVSAISVLGQTACGTTGAFTSYTDLALKVFYPGNPTPVLIYVENVLTVPHVGHDILFVSSSETPHRLEERGLTGILACTSTACSTSKTHMTLVSGKLRPWAPGNTFLETFSLPVVDGVSLPFIAQYPLPPGSALYCGVVSRFVQDTFRARACAFVCFLTEHLCSKTQRLGVSPSSL